MIVPLRKLIKENSIHFQSISPGVVTTNLFNEIPEESYKKIYSTPSLKPQDIADTISYVLSTPQSITVSEITVRATATPL